MSKWLDLIAFSILAVFAIAVLGFGIVLLYYTYCIGWRYGLILSGTYVLAVALLWAKARLEARCK